MQMHLGKTLFSREPQLEENSASTWTLSAGGVGILCGLQAITPALPVRTPCGG